MEMGRMSDGPPSEGGRSLSSAKLKESCANLHLFHSRSGAFAPPLSALWIYGFPLDFQCATLVAKTTTMRFAKQILEHAPHRPPACRKRSLPSQGEDKRTPSVNRAQSLLTIRVHPDLGRQKRVRGDRTMSMNTLSAASALSSGQSPLLSMGQTKHRKHASMADVQMENPGAGAGAGPPPVGGSGQTGSKINITA